MGLPRVESACGILGYFVIVVGQGHPRSDPFLHVLVVIASKLLLVPCEVEEGHVSSFLELVNRVISGLLICLLAVSLESR